jgi:hypothetical protein
MPGIPSTAARPATLMMPTAMPRILREVGWEVLEDEFAEIEDPDPDNHAERQFSMPGIPSTAARPATLMMPPLVARKR